MKHKVILSVFLVFFTYQLSSQSISGMVLEEPEKFHLPTENVDATLLGKTMSGSIWEVFSDRNNNPTYTDESGTQVKGTVDFLDAFFVVAEKNGYLHLVQDPEIEFTGMLSPVAQDMGWVAKEKLLLWKHALVTNRGDIDKKAMILNTLASIEQNKTKQHSQIIKFYQDPKLDSETENESRLFQVFYVYKITPHAILLGTKSRLSGTEYLKEDIVGWAIKSRVVAWDHRIAIEPNWDTNAANERRRNKKKAQVFKSRNNADKYKKGQTVNDRFIFWQSDSYEKRKIGDWRRFPVLGNRNGILKIGIMGEINSASGKTIKQEEQAELQRGYNLIREKKRKINIVFVVDGTQSMKPYFPAISTAIKNSMEKLTDDFTKNNFNFGAVVYRDFLEGERVIESSPLDHKYQTVSNFLNKIDASDTKDRDTPEAVYYGLKTALRSIQMPKDETNIIILVGDAGSHSRNDETQVSPVDIVDLMLNKNCNFLAFQVHNSGNKSYAEFITQAQNIMLAVAGRRQVPESKAAQSSHISIDPPTFVEIETNLFQLKNSSMISLILKAPRGKAVAAERLTAEIENIVKYSNEHTNKLLHATDQIIMEGRNVKTASQNIKSSSKYVSSYTAAVLSFLGSLNIPQEQLDFLCEEKYQFYMLGYTPAQIEGTEYPLFQSVLFLTRLEFSDLLRKFESLSKASTGGKQRKRMQETWIELLQQHVGGSRDELLELTFDDINRKVFGLPGTSNILKELKLKHITDPSVLDNRKFQRYVKLIAEKQTELDHIFNNDNFKYKFSSNDEKYYWISEDLLP